MGFSATEFEYKDLDSTTKFDLLLAVFLRLYYNDITTPPPFFLFVSSSKSLDFRAYPGETVDTCTVKRNRVENGKSNRGIDQQK